MIVGIKSEYKISTKAALSYINASAATTWSDNESEDNFFAKIVK